MTTKAPGNPKEVDKDKSKKMLKGAKEAYGDSITSPKMRALAKADSQPKKPVTLPKAPWEKGTNVTYDKNGRVVKEYLSAADKKLMNKMYDKKGNQTAIGKKVMDHGAKKAGKKNIVQKPRTEAAIPTMMVTRPGSNKPIKITATEWPSFKARGYHHAEQKENLNLINKIKRSGVAKGSMGKDDGDAERKRASDFQAGLDKVKANMKARQAARKANTDEANEMKKPSSDHLAKIGVTPVSKMTPAQKKAGAERRKEYAAFQKSKGITPFVPHPDRVKEAKLSEMHCRDCGCQYGNIDPDCDCPNDGSDSMGEYWMDDSNMGEALDMKQRLARGRSARKNKAKMAMGRKRAGRRIASMKVLKKRAQRAARKTMTKRLTKGIAKTDLSPARKREIEKRLDKPAFKTKIGRLVKRTIKDIRKKEIARKRK